MQSRHRPTGYKPLPVFLVTRFTQAAGRSSWVAMAEKLRPPEGRALYRGEARTVEPVCGVIQAVLGFRQLLPRGLENVGGKWNLVCLACNSRRQRGLGAWLALAATD